MTLRVVVLGGLGNFGSRIVRRLALEPGIEVIATARRPPSARAREPTSTPTPAPAGTASVATATLDTQRSGWERELAALAPQLVIHCAGPFQGQDYRVALATLGCGAHYVDLADGRAFVDGFCAAVQSPARQAGRRRSAERARCPPCRRPSSIASRPTAACSSRSRS